VAVHPAYDAAVDAFAPAALRGNPQARQQWAVEKVRQAAVASARLGLKAHATFSGALAWPIFIRGRRIISRFWMRPLMSWPGAGGRCWTSSTNRASMSAEIHPGEDLHDGVTFERFLRGWITIRAAICSMTRATCIFSRWTTWPISISIIRESKRFTSRTPNSAATGAAGVYGGYQNWQQRAGVSFAGRRADRFQNDFQQAHRV
jgi:hypothetical protein